MNLGGRLTRYPLLDALIKGRSRRLGEGMSLNGGPLAYDSTHAPQPLSLEEEAVLAFAGCGIIGLALAELPCESGDAPEAGGGNIMTHFVGRTVASGDAMHNITLFVINDEGTWMLKRPQDYPRDEVVGLSQAAREHRLYPLWRRSTSGRPTNPARPTFYRSPNVALQTRSADRSPAPTPARPARRGRLM